MNLKYGKVVRLIFLMLIAINTNSQQPNDTIIPYDDFLTFEPPAKSFIPLVLQTHKNEIRLGQQNNYALKTDGTYISHHEQPALAKKVDKKETQLRYGRQALYELLKLKFMGVVYADMDKELLTKYNSGMYLKDKNSYYAQQHLLNLANTIGSVEKLLQYFCNPKQQDCTLSATNDVYYYKNTIGSGNWGGKGATEFEQLRSYTSYIHENLALLQQWSNTIFPDNTINGYFVVKAFLEAYDFKSKGYWLNSNRFAQNSRFLLHYHNLEPANANERKLINPQRGVSILFEITPSEAEKLSEKTKELYLVFKTKTSLKGLENRYDRLKATFTLESPVIEIYKDDDLSLKIGELSIDTMITK